jgi:hypothetical protein
METTHYAVLAIFTAVILLAVRAYMISEERNKNENDELNNLR